MSPKLYPSPLRDILKSSTTGFNSDCLLASYRLGFSLGSAEVSRLLVFRVGLVVWKTVGHGESKML